MTSPDAEQPIIDLTWLTEDDVRTDERTVLVTELSAQLGAAPGSRAVRGFDNKA